MVTAILPAPPAAAAAGLSDWWLGAALVQGQTLHPLAAVPAAAAEEMEGVDLLFYYFSFIFYVSGCQLHRLQQLGSLKNLVLEL